SACPDSVQRLTQAPLQLFRALRHHLLESAEKRFHFGFLPNGEAHVVWKGWEQAADLYVALLQRLDQRHDGAFAVEHDEVRLRRNCFVAQFIELASRERFRFTIQTLTVWNLIGIV